MTPNSEKNASIIKWDKALIKDISSLDEE